ncbi:MAG: hypothetical protein EOM24_26540, partial [Chloroflexia bacterium]|nr:hypothetical protein [Chloroflexia bacterium]
MNDYKPQRDNTGTPGDISQPQRGLARIDRQIQGEGQRGIDQLQHTDQRSPLGDTAKAQRGLERIDQQLSQDGPAQLADSQEQQLPYGEIFRQNYDHVPGDYRAALRHQEQSSIQEVAVRDLPDAAEVQGPQDFDHHITYADAKLHT